MTEVTPRLVKTETDVQRLVEAKTEALPGVRFPASEYSTGLRVQPLRPHGIGDTPSVAGTAGGSASLERPVLVDHRQPLEVPAAHGPPLPLRPLGPDDPMVPARWVPTIRWCRHLFPYGKGRKGAVGARTALVGALGACFPEGEERSSWKDAEERTFEPRTAQSGSARSGWAPPPVVPA